MHKLPPSPLLQKSLQISLQFGSVALWSSTEVVLSIVVNGDGDDDDDGSVAAVDVVSVSLKSEFVGIDGRGPNVVSLC